MSVHRLGLILLTAAALVIAIYPLLFVSYVRVVAAIGLSILFAYLVLEYGKEPL